MWRAPASVPPARSYLVGRNLLPTALFTQVRGIGILRTSPFGDSPKLAKNHREFIRNSSPFANKAGMRRDSV
jgi:hypothetical protein